MNSFVSQLSTAARKRAAYTRTVSEIERMSLNTALDLEIYRPDARKIARRAVYGS